MHIHICSQELALISAVLPYVNMGYFYVCQACRQMVDKLAGTAA